ncbi:transglycosylase domain-containing protein [Metabacillus halosaccharovorans]|uniref:transglycosylase domain-containing protein n=1 Tax=Metabacillus halosaccharovorans TaxID=930124 RepID=UPI00203AD123|nr:PBP1A family penicillin-binding protein [Metabacillus halosaccharovorans]MCM3439521.1 PBP1A family penicillin-binding protein [Metabacillus halosaccharovorans]
MEKRKEQRSLKKKSFLAKKAVVKIIAVLLLTVICGLLLINILIWTSDVSKLEKPAPQPTIIYDQDGEIASKLSNSSIEGVSLEDISEDMIHAVIATEDQRFYHHHGVNYFAITKAFVTNLFKGDVVAGGSTITQQLAKNVFLSHERTYTRKMKELILTKKIERSYTKDEILERYLNQIYFGEGAWGIQRAAQTYFGKNASDLTLSESAMLAGLIKAPSSLSPIKHFDQSVKRRNIVLTLMEKEGFITEEELKSAKADQIVLDRRKTEDEYEGNYPYYIDYLIEEAIKKYDLTENEILSGGLHIYTELNPVIQTAAEEVYNSDSLFPESSSDQLIQSGSVFIHPSTGGIQALVGGRGEHTFRGFNHASQLIRQPGSTMKPLAVYTPALEQGHEPFDLLSDQPLTFEGGYQPKNSDHQYRGQTTLFDAVIHSYNIPAVWLLNEIGLEKGIQAVERFGIPLVKEDHSLPLALGGMSKGTSPLLMAQAFATFPNDGVMVEAHSIQKIEDTNGEIIAEWQSKATRVTEPEVAQKITYLLNGVVEKGTGKNAKISGIDVAGKTGTTQLPFEINGGSNDHWFVGYTPELVGAVWLGYDKTDEQHYLLSSSSQTATFLFKEIISASKSEMTETSFDLSLIAGNIKKALELREEEEKAKEQAEKAREREEDEDEEDEKENKGKVKKNKDKGKDKENKDRGSGKKKEDDEED